VANETRTPGKHGVVPRDPDRYVPFLEHYLRPWDGQLAPGPDARHPARIAVGTTGTIPPVSSTQVIDRAQRISDWRMYLNDQLGDCTIARAAHSFDAQRVYAGYSPAVFSDQVIVSTYSACGGYVPGNPSTDNGCQEPDVLNYLMHTGMVDEAGYTHKLAGWAAFKDPTDLSLMTAALSTFGTVVVDIAVQQAQEDQFSAGQPWQYVPGSPLLGYHSIAFQYRGVGYTGVYEMVTWGLLQRSTRMFGHHQIKEAYVPVSADFIQANGVTVQGMDLEQLLADMPGVE